MASGVDAKLLRATKFPPEFNQKVDMQKVNIEVMKKWIAGKLAEILGNEDDIVTELCFNLLEGTRYPDIKVLQIQLTGFLDKDTARFCKELWSLCLSAQSNSQGVPKELLEAKKLELIQAKIDAEKAAEQSQKRKEQEQQREKTINNIRQRERDDRGGRSRGRGHGDRYDFPRRYPRDSRSPPPRHRSPRDRDDRPRVPRREVDTYVPNSTRRRESPRPRARRPPSLSRSPPPRRYRNYDEPRRRRYSTTPSRTPPSQTSRDVGRRLGNRDERRYRSPDSARSSGSPSTRRSSRGRYRSLSSRSPSSSPRPRRKARLSPSTGHRSRPTSERKRSTRRSFSSSPEPPYTEKYANGVRGRRWSPSPPRRHRNLSIGQRDRRDRLTPPSLSRSRSPPSRRHRTEKRRRSRERYIAPSRRRRNTSSVSSPYEKRRKIADSSTDEGITQSIQRDESRSPLQDTSPRNEGFETTKPTNSQAREKQLREQLLAKRRNSQDRS